MENIKIVNRIAGVTFPGDAPTGLPTGPASAPPFAVPALQAGAIPMLPVLNLETVSA